MNLEYLYELFDGARIGALIMLGFLVWAISLRINKSANKWLAIFIFSTAFTMLADSLWYEDFFGYPYSVITLSMTLFLCVPAIYLSALFFVTPNRSFQKSDYGLFLPFFLDVLFHIGSFFFFSAEELDMREQPVLYLFDTIELLTFILYGFFLWMLGGKKLKTHQEKIKFLRVDIEKVDLKWLYRLNLIMPILIFLYPLFIFVDYDAIAYTVLDVVLVFSIFYIAYYISFQQEIFPYRPEELSDIATILQPPQKTESNPQKKPAKEDNLLSKDVRESLTQQLKELMKSEKPHLENDISLPKLAAILKVRSHQLSYLLNNHFNENFYAFINRHRIEESKRILLNPKLQHLSMVGVAFEAGFNSKTTFNTTFKKITGLTPTQYKKGKLQLSNA